MNGLKKENRISIKLKLFAIIYFLMYKIGKRKYKEEKEKSFDFSKLKFLKTMSVVLVTIVLSWYNMLLLLR